MLDPEYNMCLMTEILVDGTVVSFELEYLSVYNGEDVHRLF